jgi:hypothetical protein
LAALAGSFRLAYVSAELPNQDADLAMTVALGISGTPEFEKAIGAPGLIDITKMTVASAQDQLAPSDE